MSKKGETKSQAGHAGEHASPPKKAPWWQLGQKDPIAGFTGVVAIFTALLAVIAGSQVLAFIHSERASLVVTGLEIDHLPSPDDTRLFITTLVKNGGKGTAFIVDGTVNILDATAAAELPKNPTYNDPRPELRGPVLPGDTIRVGAPVRLISQAGTKWTQERNEMIIRGERVLYFFGYIDYKDEFSFFGAKKTGFCFFLSANRDWGKAKFISCGLANYIYAQ